MKIDRRYQCAWWLAACLLASTAAWAKEPPVLPEGMPAKPGQYTGFLDWVSQEHFTRANTPDDVVSDYVHCTFRAWYRLSTPTERAVIDQAARGNGMNPSAFNAYFRGVAGRFSPYMAQARVMNACKSEGDRYIKYMYAGDE